MQGHEGGRALGSERVSGDLPTRSPVLSLCLTADNWARGKPNTRPWGEGRTGLGIVGPGVRPKPVPKAYPVHALRSMLASQPGRQVPRPASRTTEMPAVPAPQPNPLGRVGGRYQVGTPP